MASALAQPALSWRGLTQGRAAPPKGTLEHNYSKCPFVSCYSHLMAKKHFHITAQFL